MFANFIDAAVQSVVQIVIHLTDSVNHLPPYQPPMAIGWRNLANNLPNLAKVDAQVESTRVNHQEEMHIIFTARKISD